MLSYCKICSKLLQSSFRDFQSNKVATQGDITAVEVYTIGPMSLILMTFGITHQEDSFLKTAASTVDFTASLRLLNLKNGGRHCINSV